MAQQDSNMDVEPPRHVPSRHVSTAFGSQYQNEHTGGFEYQQSQYNNPDEFAHMHGANDDAEGDHVWVSLDDDAALYPNMELARCIVREAAEGKDRSHDSSDLRRPETFPN